MLAAFGAGLSGGEVAGSSPPARDLGVAPRDCWPMRDACPARTRATLTPPPRGPLEVAWAFEAEGTIVGEPLVWMDWVVVESVDGEQRRLDVLRLENGKPFGAGRRYKTPVPLAPSIWNDRICLRPAPGELQVLRIVAALGHLSPEWEYEGPLAVTTEPLYVGDTIYVGTGPFLQKFRVGVDEPEWTRSLRGRTEGRLSARDGRVHVLVRRENEGYEGLEVAQYSFTFAGRGVGGRDFGFDLDVREWPTHVDAESYALVGPGAGQWRYGPPLYSVVHHACGIAVQLGPEVNSTLVIGEHEGLLQTLTSRPAAWGHRFFLPVLHEDGPLPSGNSGPRLLGCEPHPRKEGEVDITELAGRGRHTGFAETNVPVSIAAGTVFAAAGSFEADTGKILTLRREPRRFPVIPARETLLEMTAPNRLVAMRAPQDEAPPLASIEDAAVDSRIADGVVVLSDGQVHAGTITWSSAARELRFRGGPRRGVGLDRVWLLLDGDGRILHAKDAASAARVLAPAAASRKAGDWLSLAKRAWRFREVSLLRDYAAEALRRGASDTSVSRLLKQAARYEARTEDASASDAERVAKLKAQAEAIRAQEGRGMFETAVSREVGDGGHARVDLVRAVLEARAGQPEAVAWVRERVPATLDPGTPFDALEWLDFVEAASHQPITVRGKDASGGDALTALRRTWRRDLVALETARVRIVTPVAQPGRIARCLALGELACTALDGFFGGASSAHFDGAEPLTLLLFETQKAYVASTPGAQGATMLANSAGHYSPAEGVSRLFLPEGEEAFERVTATFAHELTHHWLDQRLALLRPEAGRGIPPTAPGAAIEEGFATMIEESAFDLRRRKWAPADHRADSLDIVANAQRLLPWGALLDMGQDDLHRLSSEPTQHVPMRWRLGVYRQVSEVDLFYAQGAALCHYLVNVEDGKRKGILFDWVTDLHAGRTQPGDALRRTGLGADRLGANVIAWSKARVAEAR